MRSEAEITEAQALLESIGVGKREARLAVRVVEAEAEVVRLREELADRDQLRSELVKLQGVIDGVRVIRAKVGDEVESDALGLFVSWLRDQLDDLLAAAAVPVPVVPDYTEDGEQDNAIDGLMRHVGMPRHHGKHYMVDEQPDYTDDEARLFPKCVNCGAPARYAGGQVNCLECGQLFAGPALPDVIDDKGAQS